MSEQLPKLSNLRRHNGIAGQISYTVTVQYEGEPAEQLQFVGSIYSGPVVMVSPTGAQTFVKDPQRFGQLSPEWVRRFFGYDK